ncbi:hypothetical protein [Haloarchaeobius baliensis]|uniref:hypothetical protein n=1 Tax=Haloarchaeobius baliensis TaxID=1670458 RepID=UPI003F885776
MKCINKRLSKGDTVEVGEVEASHVEYVNGALTFQAVHTGEAQEYVVLESHFSDGDVLETRGEVLAVVNNDSAMGVSHPIAYMMVPLSEYGDSE